MNISLCLITWNEEDLLEQAIRSGDSLVDEVVVVDTGSEDSTVKLAKSLGAKVVIGADRYNKAEARNQAIESASGEWIVILDADEKIADPVGLRTFLETTDADAIYVKMLTMNNDGAIRLTNRQMRCWRKGMYAYRYRAHEIPLPVDSRGIVEYTDFIFEHRPPKDRAWKAQYTLDRLLLDVEENPDAIRPIYYLGRQYMYMKQWDKAIERFEQYLETPGYDEADAWWDLSKCYAKKGDEKQRIKALYQACAANPHRREWWCELGSIYHQKGQDEIATGLLKCALEIPKPKRAYVHHNWYGANIFDLLARCLWKLKRYEEGKGYAQQAFELEPENKRLITNLQWFNSTLGDMDAFYQLHGADIHSGYGRHQTIADLVEGPRILDVGCGTGDLLLLLQNNGYELCGIDISPIALDMARKRGVKAELRQTIPDRAFNTIVMAQVLEHVLDDRQFILDAAERLVSGGGLIVSVPRDGRIPSPDHKRSYSIESLSELLSEIGDPELHSWSGEQNRILMSVKNGPVNS